MRPPSSSYSRVSVRYEREGRGTCYTLPLISREKKNAIINIIHEQDITNKTGEKLQELQNLISPLRPFISILESLYNLYCKGKNVLSAINYLNIVITTIIVLILKYYV
jgi:hypothetical protein